MSAGPIVTPSPDPMEPIVLKAHVCDEHGVALRENRWRCSVCGRVYRKVRNRVLARRRLVR